jgi:hypothetical protein
MDVTGEGLTIQSSVADRNYLYKITDAILILTLNLHWRMNGQRTFANMNFLSLIVF